MDENKQERLSIVRFFVVALLIVVAVFLFGIILKLNLNDIVIISAVTFEIFLINAIYSNHIIKQIYNLQGSINNLKQTIDKLKVKKKESVD